MVLRIDSASAVLEEPDVFTAFKVVASADADAAALGRVGRVDVDGEHVFVTPDSVRALAGDAAQAPGWEDQFQGMLGYAASKGWLDEAGAIRLHVERL